MLITLIFLHHLLSVDLFVCLHHVDSVWRTQFNWPFQRNEAVKDHPSISSGLEGFSMLQCNAESCTRQGEGLMWGGKEKPRGSMWWMSSLGKEFGRRGEKLQLESALKCDIKRVGVP